MRARGLRLPRRGPGDRRAAADRGHTSGRGSHRALRISSTQFRKRAGAHARPLFSLRPSRVRQRPLRLRETALTAKVAGEGAGGREGLSDSAVCFFPSDVLNFLPYFSELLTGDHRHAQKPDGSGAALLAALRKHARAGTAADDDSDNAAFVNNGTAFVNTDGRASPADARPERPRPENQGRGLEPPAVDADSELPGERHRTAPDRLDQHEARQRVDARQAHRVGPLERAPRSVGAVRSRLDAEEILGGGRRASTRWR